MSIPDNRGAFVDLTEDDDLVEDAASGLNNESGKTEFAAERDDDDDAAACVASPAHLTDKQASFKWMNEAQGRSLMQALKLLQRLDFVHEAEVEVFETILALSDHAVTVLARVLFLNGPYVRESKVRSYMSRAGFGDAISDNVLIELIDKTIIVQPESEDECQQLLNTSCLTREELQFVLRKMDSKSRVSNKDDIVNRILSITNNKRTIFGAAPVRIGPALRTALQTNRLFRVHTRVFSLCHRALACDNLWLDYIDSLEDHLKANKGIHTFGIACRMRGGLRIPPSYSTGFQLTFGYDYVHDINDAKLEALKRAFGPLPRIGLLQLAIELHALMFIAAECEMSHTGNEYPEEEENLAQSLLSNAKLNRTAFDAFYPDSKELLTVPSLTSIILRILKNVPGHDLDNHVMHLHHYAPASSALAIAVSWFEDRRLYNKAVELLQFILLKSNFAERSSIRARLWERLVIDLEHLGSKELAIEMCRNALKDPVVEGDNPELYGILARINEVARAAESQCYLQAPISVIQANPFGLAGKGSGVRGRQSFVHPEDCEEVTCTVEELALQHYRDTGDFRGLHCENAGVRELFLLTMGDTVLHLKGDDELAINQLRVFRGRVLDSHCGDFAHVRSEALNRRVNHILQMTNEELVDELKSAFEQRRAKLGSRVGLAFVQLMALCLGKERLTRLCTTVLNNFRALGRGGAPDLVVLRGSKRLMEQVFDEQVDALSPDNVKLQDDQLDIRFVEVKSENDRLSNKQIAWLNALHKAEIPCEVLKVSTTGNATVARKPKRVSQPTPAMIEGNVTKSTRWLDVEEDQDDIFED